MITRHGVRRDPTEGRETFQLSYADGRARTAADEGSNVTVLGSDIAHKFNKHVGDTITFKGVPFTVIGILAPTLTAPDQAASVPLAAAQQLFVKTLPPMIAGSLTASDSRDLDGRLPDARRGRRGARRARSRPQVPGIATMTGKDFDKQIGSATGILNSILVGIALISLDRRRPVGHQHHGHVDRRAHP